MAERVSAQGVACLVVDPVLVSTSGQSLGDSDVARALVSRWGSPACSTWQAHLWLQYLLQLCCN